MNNIICYSRLTSSFHLGIGMLITLAFAFHSHLYTGTSQGLTFLHAPGYYTFANTDVFWGFN